MRKMQPAPQQPEPAPRPSVLYFAALMEGKLRRDDARKPHWLDDTLSSLVDKLDGEWLELHEAVDGLQVGKDTAAHVAEEAADLANFAMFVAEKAQELAGIALRERGLRPEGK